MDKIKLFKPYFIVGEDKMFYGAIWKHIFSCKAIYVDIKLNNGYAGDKEFYKNKLSVKFIEQMKNNEDETRIKICKCKVKDTNNLIKCIRNIHNSVLLQGYGEEYEKACKRIGNLFANAIDGYSDL